MEQQLYAEAGCKPKLSGQDLAIQAGLSVLGVVAVFVAVFLATNFLIKIAAVAVFAVIIYWFPNFKYEYEYIFCDGQVDFDKIMGGARRKTLLQVDFGQVEAIAPEESHTAQGWHDAKNIDFSSRNAQHKRYVMLCMVKEQKTKVYFEPSERMLQSMQTKAPRKVQIREK
ncbi:MAG: DUF6106 family protein [Acetivibrio ethanolgignens]